MLRVGLTGELGSGKSTVARLLAQHGAVVLSSDEIGRQLMQPGEPVYTAIVEHFGPAVVQANGELDRPTLARLAFAPEHPRVEELNAIIHPAVLAAQEQQISAVTRTDPRAIVVIESALLFTTRHAGGDQPWRKRFDLIVCVDAPDDLKVRRYAQRVAGGRDLSSDQLAELEAEAERRLAAQRILPEHRAGCLVIENTGSLAALEDQVAALWSKLLAAERDHPQANA